MLPVDAAPFLGPDRPADTPLGMSDAGTLAYFQEGPPISGMGEDPLVFSTAPAGPGGVASTAGPESEAGGSCEAPADAAPASVSLPKASQGVGQGTGGEGGEGGEVRLRRQSRVRRVERWRRRLPLLDEDPTEDQLSQRPPAEGHGRPAELTLLGRRLVGLDAWEEEAD
jgi:hypothetical protein